MRSKIKICPKRKAALAAKREAEKKPTIDELLARIEKLEAK